MRLVVITAVQRHLHPVYGTAHERVAFDVAQRLLKPLNAAEQFRRQADLFPENLDKPCLAEADLLGDLRDGARVRHSLKMREREDHRRMPRQRPGRMRSFTCSSAEPS